MPAAVDQALDDVWWLEHGVPPQVADEMPWRRQMRIRDILATRDAAQRDLADREEQEAERQRLAQEHVQRMAEQGLTPGGQPLQGR